VGVPVINTGPMTIEDFHAFTDRRPDNEKWELIDGEPVLNASPTGLHQVILANLVFLLGAIRRERQQSWVSIPGIGVRISDTSLPEPDLLIVPAATVKRDPYGRQTRDALAIIEILSPSTADRDLRWKRGAYTGLPDLSHYVVGAQDAVDVVVFARDADFAEQHLSSLGDSVELRALGISLPLAEIYRDTGLV
jgi:Uma2 family endonuclease